MQTFYIQYWNGRTIVKESVKAETIESLRKRIVKDYDNDLRRFGSNGVEVSKIQYRGGPLKTVGKVVYTDEGILSWLTFPDAKRYRLSAKTGKLLDWDKYWRYV